MKKIAPFLFSMLTTSVLLVVFAIAIAYATFIENDYGTQTARILIYNASWFNVLLVITGINLVGGLFYYKAFKLKRWSMVLFHLAFILILVGAGVTRFFSFEGSIHIREGETNNALVTTQNYIQLRAGGDDTFEKDWKIDLSPYTYNNFDESLTVDGTEINLSNLEYVPSGIEAIVADELGGPVVACIVLDQQVRKDIALQLDDRKKFSSFSVSFESDDANNNILLKRSENGIVMVPPDTMTVINMMGEETERLSPGQEYELNSRQMYQLGDDIFVFKSYLPNGRILLTSSEEQMGASDDAVQLTVRAGGEQKSVIVYNRKGETAEFVETTVGGQNLKIALGPKIIELPFSLKLNDFQLERYPGSMSPSSFASEVTLIDQDENIELPYRIYMNNILDYEGYRFFQSSYDTDEQGTILSVNHDKAGTAITYLGYFLMSLGMIFTFFNKRSRFQYLLRAATRVKEMKKKSVLGVLILFVAFPAALKAQGSATRQIESKHVAAFDQLLVQDPKGRIEPVNTLASEVLRKLTRKNKYEGMTASEVFLGMSVMPESWKNEKLIKIANSELAKQLGIQGSFTSFNQLVDVNQGVYKLRSLVDVAYKKKPTERNKYDKEIINVDERVNICYQIFNGDFLRVFPDTSDRNQTWKTEKKYFAGIIRSGEPESNRLLSIYFKSVQSALQTGDFRQADVSLQALKDFQNEHGAQIIPSKSKVKLEILYNRYNVFGFLSKGCGVLGFVLLILHLIGIFKPGIQLKRYLLPGTVLVVLAFVVYTAGLAIRWYISDHAPWSNAYETLIYVGWATMLSGFIFMRKSQITLAVTTILSSLILMVAGMSWLNPEITNLVPVLKSYWLIVHVAVITASYGFLGIGALLGLLNMIIMISRTPKNIKSTSYSIVEIAIVIELSLLVGLILLTIGAFIGGVWANESWGRYWGWDPKETWALVTILVYSFILHLRKVPGLHSHFVLSAMSLIGISSVLMTFFGVNYYLSGMHSYAQGDAPPVPSAVYYAIVLVVLIVAGAAISERKHGKAEKLVNADVE